MRLLHWQGLQSINLMRTLPRIFLIFSILFLALVAKAEDPRPKTLELAYDGITTEASYRTQIENYVHDLYVQQYSPSSGFKLKIDIQAPSEATDCLCQYANDPKLNLNFGRTLNGNEGLRHDLLEIKKQLTEFKLNESGTTRLILKPSSLHKWQIRVEIALP